MRTRMTSKELEQAKTSWLVKELSTFHGKSQWGNIWAVRLTDEIEASWTQIDELQKKIRFYESKPDSSQYT